MHPFLRLSLLILPSVLLASPAALAQGIVRPQEQQRAPNAAAPALPGLAARRTVAPIPAEPSVAGLAPNAALFDAVGRGDLPAAREAVARGADINARNALGLTPLDAAVDQGRNEIAFYLLSAREVTRAPAAPSPAATALATPSAARPPAVRRAPMNTPPILASEPRGPALWSGNGGTAQPEVGFLGFDAGRPEGAAPPNPIRRTTR